MNKETSDYRLICGLEIHVELKTASKMFCSCKNNPFFAEAPNTYTCDYCLGRETKAPSPNEKAIEQTIKFGLFIDGQIARESYFERKHYTYPDVPKGYQISQCTKHFVNGGTIETSFGAVHLIEAHLEEDVAKMIHKEVAGKKVTLIDFNRSGVPLIEIVSQPEIHSGDQAVEYAKNIQAIVRYLGIADADMEKGQMRFDANVSLQSAAQQAANELPDYKVEVKNINSFKSLGLAVDFEMKRQRELLEKGEKVPQETRGFDMDTGRTVFQRSKGGFIDFKAMICPEMSKFEFSDTLLTKWKNELPKKAAEVVNDWQKKYGLEKKESLFFLENHDLRVWAEKLWALALTNKIEVSKLAKMLINKKLNWEVSEPTEVIVGRFLQENKTDDLDETELVNAVKKVLQENDEAVTRYKNGEQKLQGFFMGQIMRELAGKKPEMQMVSKVLMKELQ